MWCSSKTLVLLVSVVMIQTGITNGQQQQQPNNVGFVHPIATDTFPVNRPTVAPSEEDLTASTAPSVEPVAAQQVCYCGYNLRSSNKIPRSFKCMTSSHDRWQIPFIAAAVSSACYFAFRYATSAKTFVLPEADHSRRSSADPPD